MALKGTANSIPQTESKCAPKIQPMWSTWPQASNTNPEGLQKKIKILSSQGFRCAWLQQGQPNNEVPCLHRSSPVHVPTIKLTKGVGGGGGKSYLFQ